jgi:MFS family permease
MPTLARALRPASYAAARASKSSGVIARLWPLALGAFAIGLDDYVLAALLPAMAADLKTSQAMVGLGVAVFTAAYATSAPALAFASARYATRATVASSRRALGCCRFAKVYESLTQVAERIG